MYNQGGAKAGGNPQADANANASTNNKDDEVQDVDFEEVK